MRNQKNSISLFNTKFLVLSKHFAPITPSHLDEKGYKRGKQQTNKYSVEAMHTRQSSSSNTYLCMRSISRRISSAAPGGREKERHSAQNHLVTHPTLSCFRSNEHSRLHTRWTPNNGLAKTALVWQDGLREIPLEIEAHKAQIMRFTQSTDYFTH